MKVSKFDVAIFGAIFAGETLLIYHFYHGWSVVRIVLDMPSACAMFILCLCMAIKFGLNDE